MPPALSPVAAQTNEQANDWLRYNMLHARMEKWKGMLLWTLINAFNLRVSSPGDVLRTNVVCLELKHHTAINIPFSEWLIIEKAEILDLGAEAENPVAAIVLEDLQSLNTEYENVAGLIGLGIVLVKYKGETHKRELGVRVADVQSLGRAIDPGESW